jgi:hypothetical protein
MGVVHISTAEAVNAGAPAKEIEITYEMIEAGASELFDDSPTGIMLGQYGAEYYAEKVIKAALDVFYRGTWTGRKSPLEVERDEMEANRP